MSPDPMLGVNIFRWRADTRVLEVDDCVVFGIEDDYQLGFAILRELDVRDMPTVVAFTNEVLARLKSLGDFTMLSDAVAAWLRARAAKPALDLLP